MQIEIEVPQHILEIWNLLTLQYPDYGRGMSVEDLVLALNLYARLLADIDPDLLRAAALHHIATNKWFPKVSELREAALALMLHNELTAEEAWGEVRRAIRRYGSYGAFDPESQSYRLPPFNGSLIQRTVQIIGWRELCGSENEVADRAHFFKIYYSLAERRNAEAMLLPEIRQTIETLEAKQRLPLLAQQKTGTRQGN